MKLIDLFEDLYNTTKQDVTVNRDLKNKPRQYGANSGSFASVADKKNDPFMVRKTSHGDRKDDISQYDGYWTYIQGIVDNDELKNNPFCPRVYNVKKIKDSTGKVIMRADLEKLQQGTSFDLDILIPYFSNIFGGDYEERIKLFLKEEGEEPSNLLEAAANSLYRATYYNDYSNIQNKYLIQLLTYINSFEDSFSLDIHEGNIMFRTGGHGIQMVITDPLAKARGRI